MSESTSANKLDISTPNMNTATVTTLNDDTPMARFLSEPLLSFFPASIPKEPKAMSIAKAKTPQKSSKTKDRHTRSEAPSPPNPRAKHRTSDHVSNRAESKKHSSDLHSPSLVILPSRKRGSEHLSAPPTSKRRITNEHTPTPVPRGRTDHWSPNSSRISSPIRRAPRVVPIPAATWYSNLNGPHTTPSPETPRSRIATPSLTAKKYPSSLSVAAQKLDDEVEKNRICYNCGKKGHRFMDCLLGCGKCGKDGHRTIDCAVVKVYAIGLVEKGNIKEDKMR